MNLKKILYPILGACMVTTTLMFGNNASVKGEEYTISDYSYLWNTTEVEKVEEEKPAEYEFDYNKLWDTYQTVLADDKLNADIQGIIRFQNDLINEPILLNKKNVNYYLYKNWKTHKYQSHGSIALDPDNRFQNDDMNTVLYGHYIYRCRAKVKNRHQVFTDLCYLMNSKNYENHKYAAIITESGEVRYYQVARVLCIPTRTPANCQYNFAHYSKKKFNKYMAAIKNYECYDTGVELTYGDRMLTLQTCVEQRPDLREVVILKELERKEIKDPKVIEEERKAKEAKARDPYGIYSYDYDFLTTSEYDPYHDLFSDLTTDTEDDTETSSYSYLFD